MPALKIVITLGYADPAAIKDGLAGDGAELDARLRAVIHAYAELMAKL